MLSQHDLLWNLIPADHSFNSSKCDKLPPIDRYFERYFDLQLLGLKTVLSNAHNKNTEKLLQDYLTFISDLGDFWWFGCFCAKRVGLRIIYSR
jgi:hypothetical protein